jgi:hypothetical protein
MRRQADQTALDFITTDSYVAQWQSDNGKILPHCEVKQ